MKENSSESVKTRCGGGRSEREAKAGWERARSVVRDRERGIRPSIGKYP